MKLYFSAFSPFARKVLLTAYVTDQIKNIKTIDFGQTGRFVPSDDYYKKNPLLKIPALEINGQEAMIDSPIICEYLNTISKKDKIYPQNQSEYFFQRKIESIADGACDATVLRRQESIRPPELFSKDWDTAQKLKVDNSLNYLETLVPQFKKPYQIGEISVMCMLGYLDFRFSHEDWRTPRPKLTKWFKDCEEWAPFQQTKS